MSGKLTTHVLDTATGRPGAGMPLRLLRITPEGPSILGQFLTNEDGRCDAPLLSGAEFIVGTYELVFHVAEWRGDEAGFYDEIGIRFRVTDATRAHHVPLVLSPFGYSTYRGS